MRETGHAAHLGTSSPCPLWFHEVVARGGLARGRAARFAVGVAVAAIVVGGGGLAVAGGGSGPERDDVARAQAGEGFRNRGECVSQAARAGDEAAKRACPKGGRHAYGTAGKPAKARPPKARLEEKKDDGDPCTGPPVWAGRGRPTQEEKAAHRAARAACPDDDEPDGD